MYEKKVSFLSLAHYTRTLGNGCLKAILMRPYTSVFLLKMPTIQKPIFPAYEVSIQRTGESVMAFISKTEAFKKAIEALSAQGGGTLRVPFGVWLTGPIELRSHINLHLDKGAIILFTA
jgi:hypothetical protein